MSRQSRPRRRPLLPLSLALIAACAPPAARTTPTPLSGDSVAGASHPKEAAGRTEPAPLMAPQEAWLRGWMPLKATGVEEFLKAHPTYDGRGVLIGILDSGIDPGIAGLITTSTGERKILDLRDFSGEGAVRLSPATIQGDQITVAGGRTLKGASRVRAIAVGSAVYGGTIAEIALGPMPASDLNGDGDDTDSLAIVVVRASDGWVLFADTDGDGSLANEKPVHDFLVARETFGWHVGTKPAPVTIAANFAEQNGEPQVDLFFDTSAHGSHVAGIAAGNDIYGVAGFDGVAPGANLLGLKIANDAQGGISTTGSMLAAMSYAIRFARARHMPLVLNMSFGVGNEAEGRARIDALVDSVLAANPDVVFAISAGNDGPGLSTVGYPGSASRALTVGATFPAAFLGASGKGGDPVAYFSSRGGELAKPDIVTPGLAYSTVPRWNTGDERKGGTSMASPHAAGLSALLVSGLQAEKQPIEARRIRQALMVTARPLAASNFLDDGTGQPNVAAAWRWLATDRGVADVTVRALGRGLTAAYQERRLGERADTVQEFEVTLPADAPETPVHLRSGGTWIHAPEAVRLHSGANRIALSYQPAIFTRPGVYSAVVTGWTADTLAGPMFRLVNTVVVADTGNPIRAPLGSIAAGGEGRVFFAASAARPFSVTYATDQAGEQLLAYLHEPGGQPFREENGIGAGFGEQAGVLQVDARDVEPGLYEAVAAAPPLDGGSATITVDYSPVTIRAGLDGDSVAIRLDNVSSQPVLAQPFAVLVGGERTVAIRARGSATQHLRFRFPDWAVHATVDVRMDRAQWPLFTDFGVTLFGGDGRQLGKGPLNYAFGRLHVDLAKHGTGAAEVALFPGFADAAGEPSWSATVSIRLYADSAHVTALPGGQRVNVEPGGATTVHLPMIPSPLPLGEGFLPLAIVVVPERDRTWTLEVPLGSPAGPATP